ncbi:glycosyltransferase family 39 protein [Pseudonocardia sp. KRD291]|uniref:glycosyltransferase family 39 protein n=1 Tax=Pseudonocardia sp. KRD291 TaxID=2792007 RepID=UPI001C4A45DC|nr:glycosyltransferase family 39 protein [Pseudonocardia sp. KRD291]MBW0106453.1 glycosyltransferase family 39 protein [Pseudonocardia sp. KRD291]
MTTTIANAPSAATVPRFARLPVLIVAGVVGIAHLVAAGLGGGYWFDELLMLVIGRDHLDFGSADQPPVAPLLAALMDAIAPGSVVALRVPAVLATVAAVVVAALIARELGGDRRAQVLTAGAQATTLWVTLAGHWLTPYTLEPVQWLLLFWLLVRWVRVRDDRLLLVLGAVAGVAAETKFQVLALCVVLALSVLAAGPRELLRRPMLGAGAGVAALLAAPTLIWQGVHGWPQLQMGAIVVAEADSLYGGRWGVAVCMLVGAGVAGTVLSLYGVARLLGATELRPYRFLGIASVVMFVFFVVAVGRPYYLGGLYGLLAAAGALGLQRRREAGHRRGRWVVWPAYLVSVAAAAGMLVISPSVASPEPGRAIADATAAAYRALPAAQRERTVVMGQSYIYAAIIDGRATEFGLPPAYSGNRSYGYFTPPAPDIDSVLWIGHDAAGLQPFFGDVRRVGDIGADAGLWLATGRHASWPVIWPQLRTLSVG